MEAIGVALVVAVLGPVLLNLFNAHARKREKVEEENRRAQERREAADKEAAQRLSDFERTEAVASMAREAAALLAEQQRLAAEKVDEAAQRLAVSQREVAEQAAEAARLLLAAQRESIARTDEVARLAASTDQQLTQIHKLVNSDMTAARQSELEQTRVTLVMLKKVVALVQQKGEQPDPDDLAAIDATERRIKELQKIVDERLRQQALVDEQEGRLRRLQAEAAEQE